jgi:hypothetical protein
VQGARSLTPERLPERQGGVHYNEAYGHSDVTPQVDVSGGIGEVNLGVEE